MFLMKDTDSRAKAKLERLFASALLFFAVNTLANTQQNLCYPLAHGENELGSTNSKYIAHHAINAGWHSNFYVTNVSEKPVNIKLTFNDANGLAYSFPTTLFYDNFSSTNSPLDSLGGGAILTPGQTGMILLSGPSFPGTVTGKVTWQADACLEHAITATMRNTHSSSSRYSQGLFPLNNGDPF